MYVKPRHTRNKVNGDVKCCAFHLLSLGVNPAFEFRKVSLFSGTAIRQGLVNAPAAEKESEKENAEKSRRKNDAHLGENRL